MAGLGEKSVVSITIYCMHEFCNISLVDRLDRFELNPSRLPAVDSYENQESKLKAVKVRVNLKPTCTCALIIFNESLTSEYHRQIPGNLWG